MSDDTQCLFQELCPKDVIIRKARKGATIFMPDQPASHVYHIHSGIVGVFRLWPGGEENIQTLMIGPSTMGMIGLWGFNEGKERVHELEARAITPVEYCKMRKEVVWRLLDDRQIRGQILDLVLRGIHTMTKFTALPFKRDIEARIINILSALATSIGKPHEGGMTMIEGVSHDEIATMVGTTRPTVTRLLRHFEDLGLVKTGRRQLVVGDPDSLASALMRATRVR